MTRSRRAVAAIVVGALVALLGLVVLVAYVLLPALHGFLQPSAGTLIVIGPVGSDGRVLFTALGDPPDFGDFVWSDQGSGGLILTVGLIGIGLGIGRLSASPRLDLRRLRVGFGVGAALVLVGTAVAVSGGPVGAAILGPNRMSLLAAYETAYAMHSIGTAVMAVGLVTLAVVVGMARAGRHPSAHAT